MGEEGRLEARRTGRNKFSQRMGIRGGEEGETDVFDISPVIFYQVGG